MLTPAGTLPDATRQVGVSPNAAYRHFADRQDLFSAVSSQIQQQMVDRMAGDGPSSSPSSSPLQRLRAVGTGYIDFALSEPGWFEVAFGDIEPGEPGDPTAPPFAMLCRALDAVVDAGLLLPDRRLDAEWPCWSTVHGFALLVLHGPLRNHDPEDLRTLGSRSVDLMVAGLLGPDRSP